MIKIICEDNAKFEAETYEGLVQAMKLDMWITPQTSKEYMNGVARRCEIWDESKIEYGNAEEFIKELQRIGVIKILIE